VKPFLWVLVLIDVMCRWGILVRKVENTPTENGDKPQAPCVITACGQLQPDDPSLKVSEVVGSGDKYEEFPEDEASVEISKPEVALQVLDGDHLFAPGKC
jgi:peptidyl-prolyl isomerase D